jgi:hypothetical protein
VLGMGLTFSIEIFRQLDRHENPINFSQNQKSQN